MDKKTIALTLGDVSGIGPELVVQALNEMETKNLANWLIIGDEKTLQEAENILSIQLSYEKTENIEEIDFSTNDIWLLQYSSIKSTSYEKGRLSPEAGKQSGECLRKAVDIIHANKAEALVYGPLNKDALNKGGFDFNDDLHFFADLLEVTTGFGEVNLMDDLWVTRVTSHIPLKDVAENVTTERVEKAIRFADLVLKQAGIKQPSLAVAGLNPHAGDNGLLGKEEKEIISPVIEHLKQEGINVGGPYPSDTVLNERKKLGFDCLIAMYHDQAQIGLKLLGFNRGVTINGGLPMILVTPAHGTAFDIAGEGKADAGPIKQAIKRASNFIDMKQKA